MSLLDTASLIVTPNGYKEGTLYSVIPSDGSGDMSVTRATTATRVNSAGLVELVPYNLLQYSEDFSNVAWTQVGTTITANSTTAPNGTLTADTIAWGSYVGQNFIHSGVHTFSVYAKYIGTQWLFIENYNFDDLGAWFDIQNGVVGTIASGVTANIESVGSGWYRCSVTMTATSAYNSTYAMFNTTANGNYSRTGSSYFWGAQINEGTLKDYQKTETRLNIPRLDYSNGTCPSLLVEPQRTNLLTYSSQFDNSIWVKDNNGSGTLPVVTANYATAPDGTNSAERIQMTNVGGSGSASNYSIIIQLALSLPSTGTATIYLKSNTSSNQNVLVYWGAGQGQVFSVTPQWQRFTLNNLTADTTGIVIGTRGGSGSFFNGGDEVLDILVWGAQLEAGAYPTSYIPTTSASVTRNADVISKTGISSLIGQTEGTMFLDVDFTEVSDYNGWFMKDVANFDTFAFIQRETSGIIAVGYYGSGALQARIETAPSQPIGRYKIGFGYKNNDFVLYINGTQIGTDTSGSVSGLMNFLDAHYSSTGSTLQNAIALWKTRLTNTQLATLTTI